MAILYISAWEYITQKPFEVFAPAFYHPVVPDSVMPAAQKLEKVNPFKQVSIRKRPPPHLFQPHDPSQYQRCSYAIWILLDMFQKGIEFQLAHELDVVEILDNLDRYLLTLQEDIETGDERSTARAELVIRWRAEVYKHYYRYMQMNPEAKERLYPNHNTTQNIFHLMNLAGKTGNRAQELDPLAAKANPPFNLDHLKPKEKVEEDLDQTFVGLPKGGVSLEDDRDFNFDDFLGKRN